MRTDRVAVIGAGIGGLTAALELARRGVEVTVFERAGGPGGKVREICVDGARVDAGPTVFTMRWVFEEIFAAAGASFSSRLAMTPLQTLARHAWDSNARLDLHASVAQSAESIGVFAGAEEARGFLAFSADARRMYNTLRAPFLEASKPTPLTLTGRVGLGRLADLFAIRPFDTLWGALGHYFQDSRLRQLFARYATYCGSSPFLAPATLMLIAHVEQDGVWSIDGGMRRLADALETLAREHGVRFRYDAHVSDISVARGRVAGIRLSSGERVESDAVIANADPEALAAGVFGEDVRRAVPTMPRKARALSAVTWALRAHTAGPALSRHNVFFSNDYKTEFNDLIGARRIPADPTVYVCAQDRHGDEAPGAPERLLVLINAPADGDAHTMTPEERNVCETRVFDRLQRCGLTIQTRGADSTITTPADFHALFPSTGGALYGRATHGWAGAFQRPGAQTKIPGLYLTGGGVHPGAGVPMAALSGRTAARRLLEDRGSMRTSQPVGMRGGTSTPLATTADTA